MNKTQKRKKETSKKRFQVVSLLSLKIKLSSEKKLLINLKFLKIHS